jgi:poly-beta-1,6-N-acetyl-D-glucosamine N-deacetylase
VNATNDTDRDWLAHLGRLVVRAGFTALTLALVATPIAIAWYLHVLGLQVSEQHDTPAVALTPGQRTLAAQVEAELPGRTPPVVLAYHDIRPLKPTEKDPNPAADPKYHFVVTPEAFDAQLSALQAAGYSSITSEQYIDYLNGGPVPERSVLITFDDGTHGLWTHADKILERHGMVGVAFLITANVGANRPYYLSWQEIERMAQSGRWDFQSHTRKMHARMPIDAEGTVASELSHRRWLAESDRLETLSEFQTKIETDLRASVQDILAHGLPRPKLFAFPFSDGYNNQEDADPPAAAAAVAVVRELFVTGFNNAPPRPLPTGARAAAFGMTGRIELTKDTTVEEMLDKVRARTPVTPAQAQPSQRPDLWTEFDDSPAPVAASGTDVRLLGDRNWEGIAFGRQAAADWAAYRGAVTVSGLSAPGVENAALVGRVGTGQEVSAQVSSDRMRLTVGMGASPKIVGELPLPDSDQHTVVMTVLPNSTEVVVDGTHRLSLPANGRPDSYGGIGLTSSRKLATTPWPALTGLEVEALPWGPGVRNGVGIPIRG